MDIDLLKHKVAFIINYIAQIEAKTAVEIEDAVTNAKALWASILAD